MKYFVEKTALIDILKLLAQNYQVYVPEWVNEKDLRLVKFDPEAEPKQVVIGPYRTSEPTKPFFFRAKEKVSTYPSSLLSQELSSTDKPIVLFGLKACDLAALKMLDCVFKEPEFEDVFYIKNREQNFIVSSDCFDVRESCFCSLVGGLPYPEEGFDLNLVVLKDGFLVEVGSDKGKKLVKTGSSYFKKAEDTHISQRDALRKKIMDKIDQINKEVRVELNYKQIVDGNFESDVWFDKASTCVECSGCINVCPSCHCFLLYDVKKEDYFQKMKMWDACMRPAYARVAGGANPRKHLYERLRHRIMHKFSYFKDRYGIFSCSGCGRCFEGCPGKIDIRDVVKSLTAGATAKALS